ncbi:MAG TPA: GDP-mannose 4,6-dehydratase [Candidatus Hydrogenedentes bacterium]|nr:GDP-mannose 4,6-dehydratase [Candidatus Hydrogenedentota bacterium]
MNWKGIRVTVTGAGGFIGSHLCERLLSMGAVVRGMVHGDPLYHPGYLAGIHHDLLELIGGDLRDAEFVRRAVAGADTVFHLGAITSVAYSYSHPEQTIATNTLGTLNVCAAARETAVLRMVHTSTAGAYGNAQNELPITEEHPVFGCNPYTAGKLGGDFTAQTWHLSYDLPVATIRLFNVYGPRMGRYLIMPTIIQQLMKGPDLHLGDLSPRRTFTFVEDIVNAYIRMAEEECVVGETVHFGSQEEVTMAELVELIARLMDCPCRVIQDPARLRPKKSEIYCVRCDAAKAQRLLGWRPQIPIQEGLNRTINWITAGGYDKF